MSFTILLVFLDFRIIASELLETVPNNERKRKAIKRKKDLSRRGNYYEDEDLNIVPRYLPDLAKTANDSEEDLAQDLANKLFETKDELVRKYCCVIPFLCDQSCCLWNITI